MIGGQFSSACPTRAQPTPPEWASRCLQLLIGTSQLGTNSSNTVPYSPSLEFTSVAPFSEIVVWLLTSVTPRYQSLSSNCRRAPMSIHPISQTVWSANMPVPEASATRHHPVKFQLGLVFSVLSKMCQRGRRKNATFPTERTLVNVYGQIPDSIIRPPQTIVHTSIIKTNRVSLSKHMHQIFVVWRNRSTPMVFLLEHAWKWQIQRLINDPLF